MSQQSPSTPPGRFSVGSSSMLELNPQFRFHELSKEEKNKTVFDEYAQLIAVDQSNARSENFTWSRADPQKAKHRYLDIAPFDWNVYPKPKTSPHYIGGSVIPRQLIADNIIAPHEFIAAHAPVPTQVEDWWELVYGSGCRLIVMLTQEVEAGMTKADGYWPKQVGQNFQFKGLTVTLTGERPLDDGVILRDIEVLKAGRSSPHKLQQLQYLEWPDHGVPAEVHGFVTVLDEVEKSPTETPVFVHCSAGVGRTGTLLSVYHAMVLARNGALTSRSIFEIVKKLKQQRIYMVQKREQYGFIYQCAIALLGDGNTAIYSSSGRV